MTSAVAQITAIAKREWAIAFAAPTASLFLAAFACASCVLAFQWGGLFEIGQAELTAWFQFLPWLMCVFAPALTMSAWAGERREGSLESLLSLPIPTWTLVFGKFMALWGLALMAIASVIPLWICLSFLGPVDHGATLATLMGAWLASGAYVALCLAAGARATNQVVAFVVSVVACLVLTALGLPAIGSLMQALIGQAGADTARALALLTQFDGVQRGALEAATLVYFVALTGLCLMAATLLIDQRQSRSSQAKSIQAHLQRAFVPLMLTGLAALFIGTTMTSRALLSGFRLDATEAQSFTLSNASRDVVAGLDTPVDVTLFVPAQTEGIDPALLSYSVRVQDLLRTYARVSGGRFRFRTEPVLPFSQAEDLALEAGIAPIQSASGDQLGWFGLKITNAIDQMVSIPTLDPSNEARLEYEISAALLRLEQDVPPTIAVLSSLPWFYGVDETGQAGVPIAPIAQALSDSYPVAVLAEDFDRIPQETSVLIIAQPWELTPWQSFLVDQFAINQGRIILALDPALSAARDVGGRPARGVALEDLLSGWGIEVSALAYGDRDHGLPVQAEIEGRSLVVPHPLYFAVPASGLSRSDPVTASLAAGVHFATAGAISLRQDSRLTLEPLATTSPASRGFDAGFAVSGPGPDVVLADWPESTGPAVIAAKVSGALPSAFAGNAPPPAPSPQAGLTGPVLAAARAPVSIYLFGDADFLYSGLYQGETGAVADNEALFLNAVDALAGGQQLAAIRSRPVRARRLEVVDAIAQRSQSQLLEEQRALEVRVADLTQQLSNNPTDTSAKTESFRRDLVAARKRLRTLQTAARNQIATIKTGLLTINAGIVPALWLLLGFGLYRTRQKRATRP